MEKEPEDLSFLRHRFGRLIEIYSAYKTFLNNETLIGPEFVCINELFKKQVTHSLLVQYYSFLFSMFDDSGTNIYKYITTHYESFDDDLKSISNKLIELWDGNKQHFAVIRNNIGFHGATKNKSIKKGYAQFEHLHPFISEIILQYLRIFFRITYRMYKTEGKRLNYPQKEEDSILIQMANENYEKLKQSSGGIDIDNIILELSKIKETCEGKNGT
jgi:hypothetical protein